MKRLLLFLAVTFVVFSCSKEDDQNPGSVPNPKFTITIITTEGGTVSSSGGTYEQGANFSVTATADSGYRFTGWSNGQTEATLNITVTGNLEITANFELITYSVDISGSIAKGDFLIGSSLTFYELDSSLNQTGKSYNTDVIDNFGSYNLSVTELTQNYARIVSDGFYWNEVTNEDTQDKLTLNAIAQVKEGINVNILTHLEYSRVEYLVKTENKSFGQAKSQALTELLTELGITDSSDFGISENYNFYNGDTKSKILLVVSSIMQADRTVAEVTSLIASIANDLRDNGVLDSSEIKRDIAIPLAKMDFSQIALNVYNRYSDQYSNLTLNDFLSDYLDQVRLEYQQYLPDEDGDGIQDDLDLCPDTPSSDEADDNGCGKTQKEYELNLSIQGNGSVSEEVVSQTGKSYNYGTMVKLTAIPEQGWGFIGWSGDLTGDENPTIITIEEEITTIATFEKLDTDGDGVYDLEDLCPFTPEGFSVNSNGCHEFLSIADNGVTIVAGEGAFPGDIGYINGEKYTVVDRPMLDQIIAQDGDVTRVVTSLITDMSSLFYEKKDFNQDINSWDVSNVTNFQNIFHAAEQFNQPIDKWNVSNVTNMNRAFSQARYFNQDISSWDVSNVTNMNAMFQLAPSFNQDISSWNVSNVTEMQGMFFGALNFNQNISSWDVSNVIYFYSMFGNAINFNQPIGSWDVSNGLGFGGMFLDAWEFNQDISSWDTSNAVSLDFMFKNAFAFNQDIGTWDISKVTGVEGMFWNAVSFNQDIGNWDVSNVTAYSNNGGFDNMFNGATAFNQDIGNWDTSNITRMEGMFWNAVSFNQDVGNWDVSKVTTMERMFKNAWKFNQDISSWDVSNVTSMDSMFNGSDESLWQYDGTIYAYTFVCCGETNKLPFFEERTIQIPFGQMSFNQDLSGWCVPNISLYYDSFARNGILSENNLPVWGSCPE